MRRRVLYAALVLGAIALGASPTHKNNTAGQQYQTAQIEDGSARIADAIREIGPKKDVGCEDRKDKRSSDLCAQWKAADAARDAATASLIAAVLSAFGTFLVAWTLIETIITGRRELRAYVTVEGSGLYFNTDTGVVAVDMMMTNTGKTPAFKTRWAGNVSITTADDMEQTLAQPGFATQPDEPPVIITIGAGRDGLAGLEGSDTFTAKEFEKAIGDGPASLFVYGTVWYEDAFKGEHFTNFCHMAEKSTGAASVRPVPEGTFPFVMTPFHNDSD